jgi:hypothetical protein
MINAHQIMRLVETRQLIKLADRVLANGRCHNENARRLLTHPETAAAAAPGLALQRLGELTYAATPETDALATLLLGMQRGDGLFGSVLMPVSDRCIAATAAAIRGLLAWTDLRAGPTNELDRQVHEALDRAMAALAQRFQRTNAFNDEALGWAIVLWQLSDRREFRRLLTPAALTHRLRASDIESEIQDLFRHALALAA